MLSLSRLIVCCILLQVDNKLKSRVLNMMFYLCLNNILMPTLYRSAVCVDLKGKEKQQQQ